MTDDEALDNAKHFAKRRALELGESQSVVERCGVFVATDSKTATGRVHAKYCPKCGERTDNEDCAIWGCGA